MNDPSVPLQASLYAAARAALDEAIGVYDRVPLDAAGKVIAKFPYASLGEDQLVSDRDQCHDAWTAYQTVHVWSRAVGRVEAKTIMAQLLNALAVKLDVAGFKVISGDVEDGPRDVPNPDPLTTHRVATLAYKLAPLG